jgi:broad specificity phosphatase PhoE
MSQIYFVRHAQASFGHDEYDRLSDLGAHQARILGDYFAQRGLKFDAVYSGTMNRQIHTAQTVLSRLSAGRSDSEVKVFAEFDEYDSSAIIQFQMAELIREDPSLSKAVERLYRDRKFFQEIFERAVLRWVYGGLEVPGLETWPSFTQRVRTGVARIVEENGQKKTIAVFTSGGPISAVMKLALDLSDEKTIQLSWQIQNTAVSAFKYNEKQFSLSSFNSVAHLELEKDESLLTYR